MHTINTFSCSAWFLAVAQRLVLLAQSEDTVRMEQYRARWHVNNFALFRV